MHVGVKDEVTLVRDDRTKAILNINDRALEKYRSQREKMQNLQAAVEEIPSIKADVNEIKEMLKQLLNKG